MLHLHRYYPKTAYAWLYFREKLLVVGLGRTKWESVKRKLERARYKSFPAIFRSKTTWWKTMRHMTMFHEALCSRSSLVEARVVPGKGLGLFARRHIPPGETFHLFGFLRRLSHAEACKLDDLGETSVIQFRRSMLGKRPVSKKRRRRRSERIDWYYVDGPAKLLNHACRSSNVEFVFDKRGDAGEFPLHVLNDIYPGDELLLDYGPEFWSALSYEECTCNDCREDKCSVIGDIVTDASSPMKRQRA